MPFLLAAWPLIRRFGPYAAAIAAFLLGWHMLAVHYRTEGRAEMQATANAYKQQRDSWISAFHQSDANFHAAIDIVNQQNAQSLARARAFDQAKADWAAADKANNEAWEKSQAARKALAEIAAHGASGCKASKALTDALEDL